MKTLITSFVALLLGLSAGWYFEHRHAEREATEIVEQMMRGNEASDRYMAAIAVRTITEIDAGGSTNAVRLLSRRIGDFYRSYAHLTHNDKRTKDWLVIIEQLASTNKVVADEIYAKHE